MTECNTSSAYEGKKERRVNTLSGVVLSGKTEINWKYNWQNIGGIVNRNRIK